MWKGEDAGYTAKHIRIYRKWKKKGLCERCKVKKITEWSNNGNYDTEDRNDWEELCKSCHKKKDFTEKEKKRRSKKMRGNTYAKRCPVIQIYSEAEDVVFLSISEAAKINKILCTSIANCLAGRSKSAGGFKWRYLNG